MPSSTLTTKARLAIAALSIGCLLVGATAASAQTGGAAPPGGTATPTAPTGPVGKAKVTKKGVAIAPANAPWQVLAAINAGNSLRKKPYRWGGGHGNFYDKGYDCSGAVSFLLYAGGLLESPLTSGGLASSWGAPGRGRWITVYANKGHTYIVVAGLRFDTSAVGESLRRGSGPRWRKTKRKPKGYTAKYYPSL